MRFCSLAFGFAFALVILPSVHAIEGFVKVTQNANGAWAFEKDGRRFFSMGVCAVAPREASKDEQGRFYDGAKVRGGIGPWAQSAVSRMRQAGFNTAGAWCDEAIYAKGGPSTRLIWLGLQLNGQKRPLLCVFSPGYEAAVDEVCRKFVAPRAKDPWLIGYFLDNELAWYGEFGWFNPTQKSLLELALALPATDPNRQAALAFLKEHYGSFEKFQREWETSAPGWDAMTDAPRPKSRRAEIATMAWAGKVAERFYTVVVAAVRKHDRNHLILGSRFAGNAPGPVFAACARHCDVVSINRYQKDGYVDAAFWDRMYAMVQKPILVTEFSFRAMENRTGNRNTQGADVTVPTQADRAVRYRGFVSGLMARPYVVGMHWFQWMDQPERGRSLDGEDSNYGLVDWQDREYEELFAAARETNAALPSPTTRRGPLPPPADRDGTQWSAPPLATLSEGSLSGPVELLGPEAPIITVDKNGGATAKADRTGAVWKLALNTGSGWGLAYAWPAPAGKQLVGAKKVRVRATGSAGLKLKITFNELGIEQPSPTGIGDGESWTTPEQALGQGETTLVFDLKEAEVNPYYGSQKGNRRLDLDGLGYFGLAIPGSQGAAAITLTSIELE